MNHGPLTDAGNVWIEILISNSVSSKTEENKRETWLLSLRIKRFDMIVFLFDMSVKVAVKLPLV